MISVKIRYTDGRIFSYEVDGHAGYAECGEDIVCAGVSWLALSAARSLQDYLHKKGTYESKDGYILVDVPETDDLTEAIFRTVKIGFKEMQKQYSKFIKIEEYRR